MWLKGVEVRDLRNLTLVGMAPGPGINVLVGTNGSGKTSLLEGIHLVATGRSFQSRQADVFIQHGKLKTTVFARLSGEERDLRVGVEKDIRGGTEVRVDGERVQGSAELAGILPVVVITPRSHELVGGGPKERRSYLDWGLFHVEQRFIGEWRRYRRYLQQRNEALGGNGPLEPWDEGLSASGESLSEYRRLHVGALQPLLREAMAGLGLRAEAIETEYHRGWGRDLSLRQALQRDGERDRRDRFTHSGPHRADLRLTIDGHPVGEVLSRGQEKLLVSALWLAQLALMRERTGKTAVVLLDDLPAELDTTHRDRLLNALAGLGAQVFLTATSRSLLDLDSFPGLKVFHVEQGQITEVV